MIALPPGCREMIPPSSLPVCYQNPSGALHRRSPVVCVFSESVHHHCSLFRAVERCHYAASRQT
jgi:hypothetical protein